LKGSVNGIEYGDEITLSGSKNDRTVTKFEVEYYMSYGISGDEKAQIKFYDNTGVNGAPSNLLFDSGVFSLKRTGYNTITINDINIVVPDTFTWTISFTGINDCVKSVWKTYDPSADNDFQEVIFFQCNERIGLVWCDPPTVGSSYNDFWEKRDTGWTLMRMPDGIPSANFGARITAIPEPTPIKLSLLAGLIFTNCCQRRKKLNHR